MGLILGQFSSPLPEAQKEPVAYLYNGVRLPKLPEWEGYDYVFVANKNSPYLIASTVPLVVGYKMTTEGVGEHWSFSFPDAGSSLRCYLRSDGTWGGINNSHDDYESGATTFGTPPPMWSNYTIYDRDTGEVLMEASPDPVPVYE